MNLLRYLLHRRVREPTEHTLRQAKTERLYRQLVKAYYAMDRRDRVLEGPLPPRPRPYTTRRQRWKRREQIA